MSGTILCASCQDRVPAQGTTMLLCQPCWDRHVLSGECDCDDGTDADEPSDRGFVCEHGTKLDRIAVDIGGTTFVVTVVDSESREASIEAIRGVLASHLHVVPADWSATHQSGLAPKDGNG